MLQIHVYREEFKETLFLSGCYQICQKKNEKKINSWILNCGIIVYDGYNRRMGGGLDTRVKS